MLPTTSSPNNHKRRSRCNGSYFASRLIFSKLHRSRVKIPETILIGHDGEIFQWLFWSNESRCLLRKSYETLSEKGHDLILSKFVKRKTSASSTEKKLSIHVLAPGGRAVCGKVVNTIFRISLSLSKYIYLIYNIYSMYHTTFDSTRGFYYSIYTFNESIIDNSSNL
jgi:hypothetical protein